MEITKNFIKVVNFENKNEKVSNNINLELQQFAIANPFFIQIQMKIIFKKYLVRFYVYVSLCI